jgi:hypothetical protein
VNETTILYVALAAVLGWAARHLRLGLPPEDNKALLDTLKQVLDRKDAKP